MKKDAASTVRINAKIKKLLEKSGITAQKIVDDYIAKRFKVEEKITDRKK